MLKKALSFLGLSGGSVPAKPAPTKLESLVETYNNTAEADKLEFIQKVLSEAQVGIGAAQGSPGGILDEVKPDSDIFKKTQEGLEYVDIAMHFAHEAGPKGDNPETDLELQILQTIPRLLQPLSIPGKNFAQKLEKYIHRFEEPLQLAEARGEYAFKISENNEWIKLPLLKYLQDKKADQRIPTQELSKFFYDCPQLQHLGLDENIPMVPTSFIDIQMNISEKRVVPLYLKAKNEWFILIV